MTRKEQIEKEAIDYSEIEDNFMEYDDCGDVCDDRELIEKAFIQGAEWADNHPSVDTVKKIICYALRFTNIMLADNLEEGVEWESLIKKAMEGGGK